MPDQITVSLEPVSEENYEAIFALEVTKDQQGFVADNVYSVAQAYVYHGSEPYGVRAGSKFVGFTLLYMNPAGDRQTTATIVRFMIDRNHQRQGYGRLAMAAILEDLRRRPGVDTIEVNVYPDNVAARRLYESSGFVDAGELYGREMVYRMRTA